MPLQRLTPGERGGIFRFDAGDVVALALRLRAQIFELQLAPIELGSQPGDFRAERCSLCGAHRALLFTALELFT